MDSSSLPVSGLSGVSSPGKPVDRVSITAVSSEELSNLRTLPESLFQKGEAKKESWFQPLDFDDIQVDSAKDLLLGKKEDYTAMVASWEKLKRGEHLPKEEFDRMVDIADSCWRKIFYLSGIYECGYEYEYYNFYKDLMDLKKGLAEISLAKNACFEFQSLASECDSNKSPVSLFARKTDAAECVDKFKRQLPKTIDIVEQMINGGNSSSSFNDIDGAVEEIEKTKSSYPNGSWQTELCDELLLLFGEVKDPGTDGSLKMSDLLSDPEKIKGCKMIFRKLNTLQHLGFQKCKMLFEKTENLQFAKSGDEKYKCHDALQLFQDVFTLISVITFNPGTLAAVAAGAIFPPLIPFLLIPFVVFAIITLVLWAINYNDRMIKEKEDRKRFASGMKNFPDPSRVMEAVEKARSSHVP
jgi:hypothetical protein